MGPNDKRTAEQGNRTPQQRLSAPSTGFEDRARHQPRTLCRGSVYVWSPRGSSDRTGRRALGVRGRASVARAARRARPRAARPRGRGPAAATPRRAERLRLISQSVREISHPDSSRVGSTDRRRGARPVPWKCHRAATGRERTETHATIGVIESGLADRLSVPSVQVSFARCGTVVGTRGLRFRGPRSFGGGPRAEVVRRVSRSRNRLAERRPETSAAPSGRLDDDERLPTRQGNPRS